MKDVIKLETIFQLNSSFKTVLQNNFFAEREDISQMTLHVQNDQNVLFKKTDLLIIAIILLRCENHAALQFISKKYHGITVLSGKKVHLQDVLILRDNNSYLTPIKISKFERKKKRKKTNGDYTLVRYCGTCYELKKCAH